MRSDRLLSLLLLLQARGRLVAPEVAREFEVSVRTVYRDVEALSAAGVPVWTEQGRGGGIRLMPGYRTDMTGLTAAESRALVAMSGRAVPDDLGLGTALASAVHKLVAAVPASHRAAAEQARARVLVDHAGWFRQTPTVPKLQVVQEAVWAGRRLRLDYRSGRAGAQTRTAVVDPYGLVVKSGLWYLVGAIDGEERMWRVDRAVDATVLDEPSREPDGLDLAEVWERLRRRLEQPEGLAPVEVTVRVRAERLDLLLRMTASRSAPGEGSASGDGDDSDDGDDPAGMPSATVDGWVTLRLRFRGDRAAVATLLGFGGDLEVLGPPEVRRLLCETAAATLTRHGTRESE